MNKFKIYIIHIYIKKIKFYVRWSENAAQFVIKSKVGATKG